MTSCTLFLLLSVCIINACSKYAVEEFNTTYNNGSFNLTGYKPQESNPSGYPLYLFVTGTGPSIVAWLPPGQMYVKYMASNGFIAASVWYNNMEYPSSCNDLGYKSQSIFNISNVLSAVYALCYLQGDSFNINCSKGIVANGISQGAQLVSLSALSAGDIIKSVYLMSTGNNGGDPSWNCLNYNNLDLPQSKIRAVNGANDTIICAGSADECRKELIAVTGYNGCTVDAMQCMQNDGSGWYIVTPQQTASGQQGHIAGHCYAFENDNCFRDFDANYYPGCNDGIPCDWTFADSMGWLIKSVYE